MTFDPFRNFCEAVSALNRRYRFAASVEDILPSASSGFAEKSCVPASRLIPAAALRTFSVALTRYGLWAVVFRASRGLIISESAGQSHFSRDFFFCNATVFLSAAFGSTYELSPRL